MALGSRVGATQNLTPKPVSPLITQPDKRAGHLANLRALEAPSQEAGSAVLEGLAL